MKIHLDAINFASHSGPNTFGSRLAKQFILTGHELTDGPSADVSLVFIEPSGAPLAKKVVQRLDGIWFKPQDFHVKNAQIKTQYELADAVVYQSHFDKAMITKWWRDGVDHSKCDYACSLICDLDNRYPTHVVINNGIELSPVKTITIPALAAAREKYDQVFVCSSNWHPQKRLKENLMMFDFIRKSQHPNSCLFVMGSNPDVRVTDPHVFYTGPQPHDVCLEVFAASNWMIHLAWADHCPNVVVEGLSQGTPVICSKTGGTKELVGDFGIVLDELEYNLELYDYDKPPTVDVTQLTHLPKKENLGAIGANINIVDVAEQYLSLFRGLL